MDEPKFPRIILLLGSYDDQTKPVLARIKDRLAEAFVYHPEQVSSLLLDEVALYKFDMGSREFTIFAERYEGGVTLSILDARRMIDAKDFPGKEIEGIDEIISSYLIERYHKDAYTEFSLLEKLTELARLSSLVFFVRDQELTRGGEYIELGVLLSLRIEPSKIHFFKREGLDLSEMAWEILDLYGINVRPYRDEGLLIREAVRITRNTLGQQSLDA